MMNIITWITNAISIVSKLGPVFSWIMTMFPKMAFVPKLLAILDKINKDPNYPLLSVLKDIADLFADSVTPQPMPPGLAGVHGAPMYQEMFSTQQCTSAYHMLPDDIKQCAIDACSKIDSTEVSAIPWPTITAIWSIFGPWAQKMIELFIESWLNKRTAAIASIQKQAALPAAPPAVA